MSTDPNMTTIEHADSALAAAIPHPFDGDGEDVTVIYHGHCHDGITALWAALQRYPKAKTFVGAYGDGIDLEQFVDRRVLMVDFSWRRPIMLKLFEMTKGYLLLLDHHKTALDDLQGLPIPMVLDMNRSGAGITWDVLMDGTRRPWLIDYVEDRDLYRFALPYSKEVHEACDSYSLSYTARAGLMTRTRASLVEEGIPILRYKDRLVKGAMRFARREVIAGYDVPSIGHPNEQVVSELGHALCKDEPFAAVWIDRKDGARKYSLRSNEDGIDVEQVALSLGGGGHRHAASFIRWPKPTLWERTRQGMAHMLHPFSA